MPNLLNRKEVKGMKKGQSVLEYVIILMAVVAGVIAITALMTGNKSSSAVGKLMNTSAGRIESFSGKIANIAQ